MVAVYVRTIRTCFCLFVVSVLASIFLAATNVNTAMLLLLENYTIGIACSSLLVIIPTFLQYKLENAELESEFRSLLFFLITNMYCLIGKETHDIKFLHGCEAIDENIQQMTFTMEKMDSILGNRNNKYSAIYQAICKPYLKHEANELRNHVVDQTFIGNVDLFLSIARQSLKFGNECQKRMVQIYITAIEELKQNG